MEKEKKDKPGDIVIVAEYDQEGPVEVTRELVAAACGLAADGQDVTVLLCGSAVAQHAKACFALGADRVCLAEHPALASYSSEGYARATVQALRQIDPEIVLFGATFRGMDLAPRAAVELGTGLTADAARLRVHDGLLYATKPAFGENMMATIVCETKRPQMVTVRPGVMRPAEADHQAEGEVLCLTPVIDETAIGTEVAETIEDAGADTGLAQADVIVCGGRGLGEADGFDLLKQLAEKAGGVVAATRAAVDAGWVPKSMQIGQTGVTVRPKLFIACGVSGSLQFTAGMEDADVIVAINEDPSAPIFETADYGIVGDLYDVVPALIRQWDDAQALLDELSEAADLPVERQR